MKPNNIDKQIRETLNSREIQPTFQAWDRLDAMLSVAEEKKTKRSFGWLYIAAAILVFVSVGTFFYNQKDTIGPNEGVTATDTLTQEQTTVAETTKAVPSSEQETIIEKEVEKKAIASAVEQKSVNNQNKKSFNSNQKTNSNPIINNQKQIKFENKSDVAIKDMPKTIAPDQPIVVQKTTNSNQDLIASVTDRAPKSEVESKVKINANSLLSEVDGELDQTFREKVFKKVSKNYKEVKVALTNRNNL